MLGLAGPAGQNLRGKAVSTTVYPLPFAEYFRFREFNRPSRYSW